MRKGTWFDSPDGKSRVRVTQYHSVITATTGLRWFGEFARSEWPAGAWVWRWWARCGGSGAIGRGQVWGGGLLAAGLVPEGGVWVWQRSALAAHGAPNRPTQPNQPKLNPTQTQPPVVNIVELLGLATAQIIASASNFYSLGTGLNKRCVSPSTIPPSRRLRTPCLTITSLP